MTSETVIRNAGLYPVVRPQAKRVKAAPRFRPVTWLVAFLLVEIVCQLALLSSSIGPLRAVFRSLAFGMSLLWLLILYRRGLRHPAAKVAGWALAIVSIQFFHSTTNSWLAGVAQVALYVSIIAPVFWVASLAIDAVALRRVILILWSFYAMSSAVGVLQVYYPGKFQPNLSSAVTSLGQAYVHDLEIQTASGARVFRPMGLTDRPGGAATAGLYAGLLGLGFLLYERRGFLRWLGVGGAIVGLICLYLSQVRLLMIMFLLCALTLCSVLLLRHDTKRLGLLGVIPLIMLSASSGPPGRQKHGQAYANAGTGPARRGLLQEWGYYLERTAKNCCPDIRWAPAWDAGGWCIRISATRPTTTVSGWRSSGPAWLLDGGVPLILAYIAAVGDSAVDGAAHRAAAGSGLDLDLGRGVAGLRRRRIGEHFRVVVLLSGRKAWSSGC